MKGKVIIRTPKGSRRVFSSPRRLKVRREKSTLDWKFPAVKEGDATKIYDILVRAGQIQAQMLAIRHVFAEGTLLISLTREEMLFEGEIQPWNNESFEILSMAVDEITTLILDFRRMYPQEEFVAHLTLNTTLEAPS